MIIVCTTDQAIIGEAQNPQSGAGLWGTLNIIPASLQIPATESFAQFVSGLQINEPLCLSAHGSNAEIGDAVAPPGWTWNCDDVANILFDCAPAGYSGAVLISACATQIVNFSSALAVALEFRRALNGVWIYGYNLSLSASAPYPDPTQLGNQVDLQGTQVVLPPPPPRKPRNRKPFHGSQPTDFPDDVHQAVDTAFSIATGLASLFGVDARRGKQRRGMHLLAGNAVAGCYLGVDLVSGPYLQCTGEAAANVSASSPVPYDATQPSAAPGVAPLYSTTFAVGATPVPLANAAALLGGQLTATIIPPEGNFAGILPIMALRGRSFTAVPTNPIVLANGVQLISIDPVAGLSFNRVDTAVDLNVVVTIQQTNSGRSLTYDSDWPLGAEFLSIVFQPGDIVSPAFESMTIVLSGPASAAFKDGKRPL